MIDFTRLTSSEVPAIDKRLPVIISDNMHLQFKMKAVKEGDSMKDIVAKLIEEYVK